jgi:hypothetical protein
MKNEKCKLKNEPPRFEFWSHVAFTLYRPEVGGQQKSYELRILCVAPVASGEVVIDGSSKMDVLRKVGDGAGRTVRTALRSKSSRF